MPRYLCGKKMRGIALSIIALMTSVCGISQDKKLESFTVAYYGEMITHPGMKVGVDYRLKKWTKSKLKKGGNQTEITKRYLLSPSIGFYYHRRYQTGVFLIPEIKYQKTHAKGRYIEMGLGAGYLRTIIPNTYTVDSNDGVDKTSAGYNYFATNLFFTYGNKLRIGNSGVTGYYIKPQLMYAIPNFPTGVGYFALETGLKFRIK